jgi:hypothetical protein
VIFVAQVASPNPLNWLQDIKRSILKQDSSVPVEKGWMDFHEDLKLVRIRLEKLIAHIGSIAASQAEKLKMHTKNFAEADTVGKLVKWLSEWGMI